MNENRNWKILQIIQAQDGWTAVHCQQSNNHEVRISNRPVICWALVEPVGDAAVGRTQVRGVEQGLNDLVVVEDLIGAEKGAGNRTDQNQYFLGYNDPDAHKESDFWLRQANERLRIEREKTSEEKH